MIAPRTQMLIWTGLCLIATALLGAFAPGQAGLAYAAAGIAMIVPVFDALLAGRGLEAMTVDRKNLVRMAKGVEGKLELRISTDSLRPVSIRIGLAVPQELGCSREQLLLAWPCGAAAIDVAFDCLPIRRGSYTVRNCYLGAASPLGFWLKRRTVEIELEVRVYPNMFGERRMLSGLFLNRGGIGIHSQRQVGQGRDFEKLREYIPGDGFDEIHWKATAKRGRPVTKVFQLERTQEVYVIIDSSRLSGRLPTLQPSESEGGNHVLPVTCLERFVTAAFVMGLAAQRQGDLFGVVSFSDKVDRFIRAGSGKNHYNACREALYALQPKRVSPDISELFTFIRTRLRRRALLIVLTSLDDPIVAESFIESIPLIARQHLVMVNMIQLPGVGPVFSGQPVSGVSDIYSDLAGHLQWNKLRELGKSLHRHGVNCNLLANETLCLQVVSEYINVKQRQLL